MPLYLHGSLDCSCRAAAHLVTVTSWSVRDGAIRTVHELAVVVDHGLDLALTLKVADRQASQRAVDLQTVDELSLIHISEPTRPVCSSRMPSSA